jgi:hypothetical protein
MIGFGVIHTQIGDGTVGIIGIDLIGVGITIIMDGTVGVGIIGVGDKK